MELFAEYELRCAHLPLVSVAHAVPEATIDLAIQPNRGGRAPVLVWVSADDAAAVEAAFERVDFVASHTSLGETDGTRRYNVLPAVTMAEQLGDAVDDLDALHDLATTDSLIESIRAQPFGWVQTGWFADRSVLDAFRTFWQRNGGFAVRRLTTERAQTRAGLTDRQREALVTAHEMGYFEVPRRASLAEVADRLDITASSLSERLRRAQAHLVETAVEPADGRRSPAPLKRPHD